MTKIPPLPPGVVPDRGPLIDWSELKVGDVVQIAVQKEDRARGDSYWWKRFAVVTEVHNGMGTTLNLKAHPNLEEFVKGSDWNIDMSLSESPWGEPQVVTKLNEPWPQGVAALHMKYLTLGIIKLGGDDG